MATFSLCQLSNASRRLSLSLLRQHQNKFAVSKRQPSPFRLLLSLQQPRYLHTGDDAKPDESTPINSDIAAEEGIEAHGSVDTSNEVTPIVDDSIKSSDDVTRDQDVGDGDGDASTPDPIILSSDPRDEPKVKARPWTEEDLAHLEGFIRRPYFSVLYIAKRMDRRFENVMDQLKQMEEQKGIKLLNRSWHQTPWQHTMDATPEQDAIFEAKHEEVQKRMEHIVETLMTLPKTDQWEEILKLKSASEWASAIMKLIPLRVWHILAGDNPPSEKEYGTIPMADPYNTFGLFAQIYQRRLYIGFADKPFGLMGPKAAKNKPIKRHGLVVPLIPVSSAMLKQLTHKENVEQRYTLGLARAALAAWLGAYQFEVSPTLRQLYAWWEKDVHPGLHHFGLIFGNPLERRLILPLTPEARAARRVKHQAEALEREGEKTVKEVMSSRRESSTKKRASDAWGAF
ncbi:hypothetical protein FVEG_02507 [Fusarium verticillioides 7600]|uniref:Uncharacterized protein n=1 Tax=Gibberella moniliformis (strain M3125 / FGSC 7600) TaxID=334819 RepID=W7LWK8_GIBM7|nr:hypothetical protein FVEG_02507 [Fusarium verticillioides 7600]EWG39814.1 hypothetical protein FVEG_02507 [Fusarium verticillioides 7600]